MGKMKFFLLDFFLSLQRFNIKLGQVYVKAFVGIKQL